MDLSAFSKDNFDAKEWINSTFLLPEAKKNKEEYASTLVAKLQSFIQEVNISLEKTAEQVIQNIPRIIREVDSMRQEAQLLKEQMSNVKEDVIKVERDSSKSMHTLLKIDHVKSCMQEASKALREADNWTTLSADVDEVFESGDVNAISAKLIGMQNSLEILVDVPDYKERCARLESLKDRLEAIISPQLVAAFSSQSVVADVALVYMKIFRDIKRLHRLQKYYHNYHKSQLLQQWSQIVESDPEETLTDWLNNLNDTLLSTWHSQMSWCNQLLVDIPAVEVLSDIIVDVLTNLEPPLSFCIEAAMKQSPRQVIYLIELKQITDRFSKSLDVAIQAIGPNLLTNPHVVALVQTIYAPYRPYIEKYASMEEKQLVASLNKLNFESEELMDSVNLLGESVSKVFYSIQEADTRCHQLTHGCGYGSLLLALKGLFEEYLEKFKNVLRSLRSSTQQCSKGLTNDWVIFQQSLHNLQIAGEVLLQLESLEQLLTSNIREVGRKLGYYSIGEEELMKLRDPFHAYDNLLLTPAMKKDLQHVIYKLQEDADLHLLGETINMYKQLCNEVGSVVFSLVLEQVQTHLQQLWLMKVWSEENTGAILTDLPTFSLSPQEYITEVGQYLMTIPQHIEPFILQDNPALCVALKSCKKAFVSEQDPMNNVADYLLECLAQGITETYIEAILKISGITPHNTNQLVTDISYFCDVLDDLGLVPPATLQQLMVLLKAKPEEFQTSAISGIPAILVNSVKSMRKIK